MAKKFRDFKSARKFVRELGLQSQSEWRKFIKSGSKPDDIPSAPHNTYKNKGWKNMGDWLGTERIADQLKEFRDYKSAREFARSLKFTGRKKWIEYCKSGSKPEDIPAGPNQTYKDKGWTDWGDWLGTGSVATKEKVFRDFESAREFARRLGLRNNTEWREYCKSGSKPKDIPVNPDQTYKNKGWIGFGDWLGTGSVGTQDMQFSDFELARKFARELKLQSQKEWIEYCKSGNKPEDIPAVPNRTYKNKGWIGFGDWLGTRRVADQLKEYRDFKSSRKFARELKLQSQKEWIEYCKSGNKPEDIPGNPDKTYKNKGWIDWGYWLGTGSVASQKLSKQYLPFKEAREEARKLAKQYNIKNWNDWKNAVKKGLIPKNIPANPNGSYRKKRKEYGKKV